MRDLAHSSAEGGASIPTEQAETPVVSGMTPGAAIITGFFGMKCDAPDCSWSDMTVQRAEYPAYRNKPCPNCGENLLTDEDWNLVLSMEVAATWINENADRLGIEPGQPGAAFDVDFDEVKAAVLAAKTIVDPSSPEGGNEGGAAALSTLAKARTAAEAGAVGTSASE